MALARDPELPSRPNRPRWVYYAGALVLAVFLAAVLFALAFRAEHDPVTEPVPPSNIAAPQQP